MKNIIKFFIAIIVVLSFCCSCGSKKPYLGFWQCNNPALSPIKITDSALIVDFEVIPIIDFSTVDYDYHLESYPESEYIYIGWLTDESDFDYGTLLYDRNNNCVVYLAGNASSLYWDDEERFYPVSKLSLLMKNIF